MSRTFLTLTFALSAFSADAKRPNVVVFRADDQVEKAADK
jgi:hypothetical protein